MYKLLKQKLPMEEHLKYNNSFTHNFQILLIITHLIINNIYFIGNIYKVGIRSVDMWIHRRHITFPLEWHLSG